MPLRSTNIVALQKHAKYLEEQNATLKQTKQGLRETAAEQGRKIKRLEKITARRSLIRRAVWHYSVRLTMEIQAFQAASSS